MHTVLKVLNRHDNFKYRIVDDEIIYFDNIHASFTDRISNTKKFKYVFNEYNNDLKTFINNGKEKSLKQGDNFFFINEEERVDVVYFSTLPTVFFTAITQAMNVNKKDAIPKIGWGQFKAINNEIIIPFNLVVNHAFIDGIHVEEFLADLQAEINKF
jgi:chloramphenicol O-acetyltransferase